MVDHSKRKTLQLISSAGVSAMYGMTAFAGNTDSGIASVEDLQKQAGNSSVQGSFSIQLITGRMALEDTIIFINDTGADIRISNFLPGIVTQNEQMIDLNSLLVNGDILLRPGYPLATTTARWEPLSLYANHSYLWCDSAVSRFPDSDTGVITLDAVVNNGNALLTAKHEELLFS